MVQERMPRFAAAVVLPVAAVLGGCGTLGKNEEAGAVVARSVIGMPAGDFFERYGRWHRRFEQLDGSTVYGWQSPTAGVGPDPTGPDPRVCVLHVVADKQGRIAVADVVRDNPGRTSASRCRELFR